ncbi:PilN domain-containing protein [Tahibacter amnicola]|uniref:PilN domain-containing protein n=1 Tax=Tahibacter amnicola TaxID=2976241 RepID=A0ABY6BD85_9GAMM|nr:PilN domain-containing protein [Tahibacter amnicola]UXI67785.1 PilN domain-containing protein [Tahibacter amnicola]
MAILDVLEPQLVRLRARYAKTPLPRFFAWWAGELVSLLPAKWRAALAEGREALLLHTDGDQLIVRRETATGVADLGTISLQSEPETQRAEFARLRQTIDEPQLRQFYCVSPKRVLRRSMSLPAATEGNLRQVLSFEMDRQTPFKADQVYFDFRELGRDAAGRQLHVDLLVMPRSQFDQDLAPVTQLGIALDGVDCWQDADDGRRLGVNLLPNERRARRRNTRLLLNLGLASVAVIMALAVMARTVSNREDAVNAMTEEVAKAQNDAKQVAALRKTLEETIDSANFLAQKKASVVPTIELLDDLTKRLPDNTYLERLNITEDGRVELQGLGENVESLIAELQKSNVLAEPAFQGVIQPDPRLKKDRFNLVAQLKRKEAPKDAVSKPDAEKPAGGDTGGKDTKAPDEAKQEGMNASAAG